MQRIRPAIVVALGLCLLSGGVARAAPACESQVLRDWSHDGRIDRVYRLPCYEDAIDLLPTDLRDYTDAEDVIERALASAIRRGARNTAEQDRTSVATDRDDASPSILLAVLGGISLALLAAGGVGYVSRRRRPVRSDDDAFV